MDTNKTWVYDNQKTNKEGCHRYVCFVSLLLAFFMGKLCYCCENGKRVLKLIWKKIKKKIKVVPEICRKKGAMSTMTTDLIDITESQIEEHIYPPRRTFKLDTPDIGSHDIDKEEKSRLLEKEESRLLEEKRSQEEARAQDEEYAAIRNMIWPPPTWPWQGRIKRYRIQINFFFQTIIFESHGKNIFWMCWIRTSCPPH